MNIYFLIMLIIMGLGLLISANEHGKPKKGQNNFWATAIGATIQVVLLFGMMGWTTG